MIPVLRFKPGVTIVPSPGGVRILATLDNFVQAVKKDLLITAGSNGHTVGKHVVGEAFDCSVQGWMPHEIRKLLVYLNGALGSHFYVQYEVREAPIDADLVDLAVVNPQATAPHVHVQVARHLRRFPPSAGADTGVPV